MQYNVWRMIQVLFVKAALMQFVRGATQMNCGASGPKKRVKLNTATQINTCVCTRSVRGMCARGVCVVRAWCVCGTCARACVRGEIGAEFYSGLNLFWEEEGE